MPVGSLACIDADTPRCKAAMARLTVRQRKVLASLAYLDEPARSRDVAAMARLDVHRVSACLGRLVTRALVRVVAVHGRVKHYALADTRLRAWLRARRNPCFDEGAPCH
jgi:DNA-binding MarR family transcriptional regulator